MVLSFDTVALIRLTGRPRGGEIWPRRTFSCSGSDRHVPLAMVCPPSPAAALPTTCSLESLRLLRQPDVSRSP